MHAAVIRSFDSPPRYELFDEPQPGGEHEIAVDVLAAALHPRVRSGASGSHYSSRGALPMVPGVDGVGRARDGRLLYFVSLDGGPGTMAERTVIDTRRAVELDADADPAALAAAMNPAMSSWLALRRRIEFQQSCNVLVLGATGSAGRMAVQISRLMGAGSVIAAGRDPLRLAALTELGADRLISLAGEPDEVGRRLQRAGGEVDVVIDYLWGAATELAIRALVSARAEPARPLRWIEVGSMSGTQMNLPSAALRAANLQLLGSGQGALSTEAIVEELPQLAAHITAGTLDVQALATPLSEVESAWNHTVPAGQRTVFTT